MTLSADSTQRATADRPSVLVVDDSALFREVATELCDHAGMAVVATAADAEAAIELLADGVPVDLVLMDVQLPGMSGPEASRLLTDREPTTKVLLVSALDRCEVDDLVADCGAIGFVSKGDLDADVLRRAVGGASTPDGAAHAP